MSDFAEHYERERTRGHPTPAAPSANGADPADPAAEQTPDPLALLSGLLGGRVTVLRVANYREGRRSRYVFTVRDPRSGQPADTRALASDELLALANLQAAIHAPTGEITAAPRRNSEPWRRIQAAITEAAEVIDEADEERAEWRYRIERYTDDRLSANRDEAAKTGEPFAEDRRIYLSSTRLSFYIDRVLGEKLDKGETHAGLRDQGYEPVRVGHENVRYWRSPEGWQR